MDSHEVSVRRSEESPVCHLTFQRSANLTVHICRRIVTLRCRTVIYTRGIGSDPFTTLCSWKEFLNTNEPDYTWIPSSYICFELHQVADWTSSWRRERKVYCVCFLFGTVLFSWRPVRSLFVGEPTVTSPCNGPAESTHLTLHIPQLFGGYVQTFEG